MTTFATIVTICGAATITRALMRLVDMIESGAKKDRATAGTVTRSRRS